MYIKQGHKMVQKGTGRFLNRKTKVSKKEYDRFFIYCPTELSRDSNFPFHEGDPLEICIHGEELIIRKKREE